MIDNHRVILDFRGSRSSHSEITALVPENPGSEKKKKPISQPGGSESSENLKAGLVVHIDPRKQIITGARG